MALLFPLLSHTQQMVSEEVPTREDKRRLTLSYQTAANPDNMADLTSYELGVGLKFQDFWLESFFSSTSGPFDSIASNSDVLTTPYSEGFFRRTQETTVEAMQIGMGPSLEGLLINRLLGTTSFYEYSTAYLTYTIMEDSLRPEEEYSGVGLRADYSINYRYSSVSHLALRLSYRFSPLRRSATFAGESGRERSLMLSWPSVGLDLSYFF